MIEKQNRIIIVDDSEQELKRLGNAFLETGIGCRTFLYTQDYDNEALKNVRIAFFDINLANLAEIVGTENKEELKKNNSKVFNDLSTAISQFISPDNGPYILIFWTKNQGLVDVFKEYVNERKIDILNPLQIYSIDKFEFEGEKINTLPDKILEIINSNEKIKFLFDLQENSRKAGEETINRLFKIIPKDELWGESSIFFENLDMVLSKIASSTLGCEHAKENKQKAVYEGLLPIINYELINSKTALDWDQILAKLHTSTDCRNIVISDNSIQNKLNSLYHIEEIIDQKKDARGSLIEIDKNSIEPLKSFNIEDANKWMMKTIPFRDQSNSTIQKRTLEILSNSKIIAIEISAACDFSNKKSRINKYILGTLSTNLNDKDLNLKSKPENCYLLGGCSFYYEETPCHIWINFNYVFSAKPNDPRFGEKLFVLKKEIMDMLGHRYASHISRIGITSL